MCGQALIFASIYAHLVHEVVVMLLELCNLLLADRLQVVVQRVGSDDFDEVFHRVEDFHVLALSTSNLGIERPAACEA